MEVGFLTVLITLYKLLAILVMFAIASFVTFGPIVMCVVLDHPLPLLIYLATPLILAILYKLFWLL